jgi:hypothetical protein
MAVSGNGMWVGCPESMYLNIVGSGALEGVLLWDQHAVTVF